VGVNILDLGIGWLWESMGWARTDAEAFSELIAFAFNPLGAVVLAISAGVGEELGVRGVLQPRLGILFSNLFFTSLHAFQYNWDALLVVFLIGLIFGVLRKYTNTTTSALAHALYDFILVMLAIYGVSVGS
ncbi:MAG: CPBP family intramembrane metalloprotease, partial [Caldilineae bacterium]